MPARVPPGRRSRASAGWRPGSGPARQSRHGARRRIVQVLDAVGEPVPGSPPRHLRHLDEGRVASASPETIRIGPAILHGSLRGPNGVRAIRDGELMPWAQGQRCCTTRRRPCLSPIVPHIRNWARHRNPATSTGPCGTRRSSRCRWGEHDDGPHLVQQGADEASSLPRDMPITAARLLSDVLPRQRPARSTTSTSMLIAAVWPQERRSRRSPRSMPSRPAPAPQVSACATPAADRRRRPRRNGLRPGPSDSPRRIVIDSSDDAPP